MSNPIIPPEKMLSHYGKSFAWAGKILPKKKLHQARIIYAFCRYADDVVDESTNMPEAEKNIAIIQNALNSGQSEQPILRDFLALQNDIQFSLTAAQQLLTGIAWDLSLKQIASQAELIAYAYHVAGTVGLLMLPVLEVSDSKAKAFAIDLGIGMQLTNIARDVLEDAKRGRVYLPRTWLNADFDIDLLLSGDQQQQIQVYQQILKLLELADVYYASARSGMHYIPFPARLAILTASHLYQGIGNKIRALGAKKYWQQRAYTNKLAKLSYSLKAAFQLLLSRRQLKQSHNKILHEAITDLLID